MHLALNAVGGATGPNNVSEHFGIQVKSTDAVREMAARLESAGLATLAEENVTCCYSVQDKVWITDPDGNRWEVFVVLDNDGASHAPMIETACCPQMEDVLAAARRGDLRAVAREYDKATDESGCCAPGTSNCCTSAATAV